MDPLVFNADPGLFGPDEIDDIVTFLFPRRSGPRSN
jgi:hypothetical protein